MGTVILVRIINNINRTGVTMGARTTYPSGIPPVHFVNLHVFTSLIPCCDFRVIKCVFHLYRHLFCQDHILYILYVFIYVYWCPILFLCQKIFVSFSSSTMGVANGAGTKIPSEAHAFTQFFWWFSCCSIVNLLCSVCRLLFVLWYFFFLPLNFLFLFE